MKKTLFILLVVLLLPGCVETIAIRTVGGIMDYGFEAFNEEADLQLAHEALGSNLKLIEALIKGDPKNQKLLLLAAQGYNAYALAFAEDDSVERARMFYLRAKEYSLRILNRNARFRDAHQKSPDEFQAMLRTMSKSDVPAIFWTAFAAASYVNICLTDLEAMADVPKIIAMMEFVIANEPTYYYGGAYLALGSIEATKPPALGGRPEKAKEYFEKAIAASNGKFLLATVYYAKTYAVQVQDQELFLSLLKKVEEASPDILPEARLPNSVAKHKARVLSTRVNELF
ncbi:MAG: TRAP transporter TatT component family protein [bacterium]